MFVDDSRLIRFAAQRILRAHHDVIVAENGAEAWRRVREDPTIRAVITDLIMPEVDGVELIRRIRADSDTRIRRLPVLVVTSVDETHGRRRALDAGADDLVPKPFSASDLTEPLRAYLQHSDDEPGFRAARPANVENDRLGLVNRIGQVESFHRRHGLSFSMLHVRLDDHSEIARTLGVNHAEAMMRHLERAIAREVRAEDSLGRSEENACSVIMMATSRAGAKRVAERLRERLMRTPVRFPGRSVPVRVAVAIQTVRPDRIQDARALLREGLMRLDGPANVSRLPMERMQRISA
ncbi:MAG: GGDEF domain-containing response regulator [Wenzhouxiangellaceae bacterium]